MTSRYINACAIADGACNPSGIAHAIVEACQEIRSEPVHDTKRITNDPAVRLMVYQLAFICGITSGAEQFHLTPSWSDCYETCKRRNLT